LEKLPDLLSLITSNVTPPKIYPAYPSLFDAGDYVLVIMIILIRQLYLLRRHIPSHTWAIKYLRPVFSKSQIYTTTAATYQWKNYAAKLSICSKDINWAIFARFHIFFHYTLILRSSV